jgi:predicted acyltransferase
MSDTPQPARLVSLDQFRGYTVLGMLLVNFVGSFAAIQAALPLLKHHHTYCSYADTIMPQFLFAVGFSFRLTFLRRLESISYSQAAWHAITRNLALLLVAFVVYGAGFSRWEKWDNVEQYWKVFETWLKRDQFQTLTHIAVTSLLVLPFMAARSWVLLGIVIVCGVGHTINAYFWGYRWTNTSPNGVDGGPLGVLTWAIPLLFGCIAHDSWKAHGATPRLAIRFLLSGLFVMLLAYALSCVHLAPHDHDQGQFRLTFSVTSPPFQHVALKSPTNDLFTMSQRSGSMTYTLFGAGFSLLLMGFFSIACDQRGFQLGVLRTLGSNALAAYIIHGIADNAVKAFMPKDSPLWYVFAGFTVYFLICYLLLRGLEKQKLFLKL